VMHLPGAQPGAALCAHVVQPLRTAWLTAGRIQACTL
jgi:hypothetical protein